VVSDDDKLMRRMAPALKRVLVVDSAAASARVLAELMRDLAGSESWVAPNRAKAGELLQAVVPQIVFVEYQAGDIDGLEFTRHLRKSDLPCRQAPVIMVTATATAQAILGARDAGVHEFLRKPYNTKDLVRRLEASILKPRSWVEAVRYIGPDRRRFNSAEYAGPRKRRADVRESPDQARIAQALKILKSAVGALQSDTAQALRAMRTQASELQQVGVSVSDLGLTAAAAALQRCLTSTVHGAPPDAKAITTHVAELLKYMPPEEAAKDAARDATKKVA
jgi:CheY-like chemotaxis protein